MAITTQSMHLIYSADGSSYDKISAGTPAKDLCIKDFPDLTNGDPDQVETTTLCDTAHQYIDGLENLPEELEFTANFDNDLYDAVASKSAEAYWGIQLGTTTGNPRWTFKATARVELVGGGVGDVLEMRIVLRPKSTITKSVVA